MAQDPKLNWTLLEEGTSQAEVLVNELLARLLASTMSVKSIGDTTPPGSPVNFDAYILGGSPTGAWAGQGNDVAVYLDGWKFLTPKEGARVRVEDTDVIIDYDGTNWSALEGEQTLTDGATINWDMSLGRAAVVTLGGNRTMAAPTNIVDGRIYTLVVIQDATPPRTLTWNSVFKWAGGTAPTLTNAANAVDLIRFVAYNGNLYGDAVLNLS